MALTDVRSDKIHFVLSDRAKQDIRFAVGRDWKGAFERLRKDSSVPVWIVQQYDLPAKMSNYCNKTALTANDVIDYLLRPGERKHSFSAVLRATEQEHPDLHCSRLQLTQYVANRATPVPVEVEKGEWVGTNAFPELNSHAVYFESGKLYAPLDSGLKRCAYTPGGESIWTDQDVPGLSSACNDQAIVEELIRSTVGERRYVDRELSFDEFVHNYNLIEKAQSVEELGGMLWEGSYLEKVLAHFGSLEALQQRLSEYNQNFYPGEIRKAAESYNTVRTALEAFRD